MQPFITFDIETGPGSTSQILEHMPAFVPPGNIKDPEKIEARRKAHTEDAINEAALDALTGRVLAIGVKRSDGPVRIIHESGSFAFTMAEFETIETFWGLISSPDSNARLPLIVGFNSHSFDLPFLVQRSWILGVTVPSWIRQGRYWDRRFVDLREVWTMGDRHARGSLDSVCRACGLGSKNGDGANFHKLWETNRPAAIEYLKGDIKLTEALALRWGVGAGGKGDADYE